jgi:hypothetical protein
MVVLPPARLSTMVFWPNSAIAFVMTVRAKISFAPPGD